MSNPIPTEPPADTPVTDRAGILLVDDMEENLLALEAVLASLNVPLVRARSGEEAIRALRRERFALVLLDVRMPGMDGFDTAAAIKRLDQAKDVPIIFLTGSDLDSGFTFRGYARGAADFIPKPFDPWVLRAKATVFLELHRKNRQLEALLARDHVQLAEMAHRLSAIGSLLGEPGGDIGTDGDGDGGDANTLRGPGELAALRGHVAGLDNILRELRRGRSPQP
ncbi:response regulator [Streptomyces sp. IB2014 016-6]|uniref:response regulator n=1 Tax=Streptomyces sp. IB2014 016-6 TaxID=2517818 RepID=UPI0011CB4385|nr:response regulator [Streptomyces sp. IB2014 016-6]TXL92468.1 response regulator [Streptomyces sp. IB2014 016-6]